VLAFEEKTGDLHQRGVRGRQVPAGLRGAQPTATIGFSRRATDGATGLAVPAERGSQSEAT